MPSELETDEQLSCSSGEDEPQGKMTTAKNVGKEPPQYEEEMEEDRGGKERAGGNQQQGAEEMEDDEGGIRIRAQTDGGIFEQDDDNEEEDDDLFDFPMPEVDMQCPPSRKRKQELSLIEEDELGDVVEVDESLDHVYAFHEQLLKIDDDLYQQRRTRERLPLYLLRPEDYPHDQKKQMQIRRAIITYRHHREKKELIINLTDENKSLREYVDVLKNKIKELSQCGCEKNACADLSVLDFTIPVVPPRMYVRGGRPTSVSSVSSAFSQKNGISSPASFVKCELDGGNFRASPMAARATNGSMPPLLAKPVDNFPKPLVNITSSRLAGLNSKTLSTATNVVTHSLPKPPLTKVIMNGTQPSNLRPLTASAFLARQGLPGSSATRVSISGMSTATSNRPGFISLSSIKSEPGVTVTIHQGKTSVSNGIPFTASAPSQKTANSDVNLQSATPATATPVSRIVFAKKGSINSNALQTASQLYFGTKSVPEPGAPLTNELMESIVAAKVLSARSNQKMEVPMSQKPRIRFNSPFNSNATVPSRLSNQSGQVFKTASGQVLKVVSTPTPPTNIRLQNMGGLQPEYQRLLPKSISNRFPNALNQSLDEVIQEIKGDNDDEMAILAAMDDISPLPPTLPRTRKQNVQIRKPVSKPTSGVESRTIVFPRAREPSPEHIELSNYADIVFEEAD